MCYEMYETNVIFALKNNHIIELSIDIIVQCNDWMFIGSKRLEKIHESTSVETIVLNIRE